MEKKLIILTRSMFAGGAERVIAQLANYFVKKEVECTLVTIDNEKVLYDLDTRISVIPVGKKADGKVVDKFKRYQEVRRIVSEIKPDVVLSMPEDIGIYVILALIGTRIPVFVSERNNPWVMPDVKVTRILRRLMYPFASGIIFQTEMAKSFFPKSLQKRGIVIGNPVDAKRIPVPYEGERKKVIVGAGRLDTQKNFSLLISAFAEFSKEETEYELVIFGEGRLRNQLKEEAKSLYISEKVHLPGRKNDLLEIMNSCSMFVLSSDYEGMPNVLIEAMCMGMPVISTDCPSGGPRELIKDHVNGILIPVGDKAAMVAAMKELSNQSVSKNMGRRAFEIRETFVDEAVFITWYNYLFADYSRREKF